MKELPTDFQTTFKGLTASDFSIIDHIDSYLNSTNTGLSEKLRLARLLAQMDLDYDHVNANKGNFPACEVLRVANCALSKLLIDGRLI